MVIAAALGALLALFPLAAIFSRRPGVHAAVHAACLLACLTLLAAGLAHLSAPGGADQTLILPIGLPWMSAHFRLDSLSALFVVLINLGGAAASAYGIGYASHLPSPKRATPFVPLFLFGMNMVLLSDDAFVFLVSWEFMSLASWALVLADYTRAENRRAGAVYIVMAVFGTFCLLSCFGTMVGPEGDYSFAAMRAHPLAPTAAFLCVLLAVAGTGSKAGMVPLHAWLPLAHPAAPSHVSALMSGVMTKVALYAMIRILLDLRAGVPWQWGAALMVLGAVTAVLGILYAVLEDDLKTLLAYSTVENVGVALIGIGLAVAFRDNGEARLATVALVAALYHMFNHSIFKSLLFLGTGAVLSATGERRLSALGGLLNRMPWTGALMLIGAASISALPPFNGFVSEWLTFQILLKGPSVPHWAMKFEAPVVGALLALAAALAAACFVRVFGVAFLGRPRTAEAAAATEVGWWMRAPMLVLGGLCVILGAVPVSLSQALSVALAPLTGATVVMSADLGWPWLSPAGAFRGSYSGTVLALAGLALFGITILLVHRFGTTRTRRAPAWDCGHAEDIVNAQYSGQSFSEPLARVFASTIFGASETVEMPEPGDMGTATHTARKTDPIWVGLYQSMVGWSIGSPIMSTSCSSCRCAAIC